MPLIQQVMTAAEFDPATHLGMLPLFATPKVDGIRFYIQGGKVWTRSNELVPNLHIQKYLPLFLPDGVDGELVAGDHAHPDHFQLTTSMVMSHNNPIDDLHIFIFDYLQPDSDECSYNPVTNSFVSGYDHRIAYIHKWFTDRKQLFIAGIFWKHTETAKWLDVIQGNSVDDVKIQFASPEGQLLDKLHKATVVLTPTAIRQPSQVDMYLEMCLKMGFEGIMLRHPQGGYKFGRSTPSQGWLLKHKPLADSEAEIIDFVELQHNDNPQSTSATGRVKRSTSIQGKRAGASLGSFLVRDIHSRVEFSIGGGKGLTQELRQKIWDNPEAYRHVIVKYSYLKVGTKVGGKPRMPKFLGFRDKRDMS